MSNWRKRGYVPASDGEESEEDFSTQEDVISEDPVSIDDAATVGGGCNMGPEPIGVSGITEAMVGAAKEPNGNIKPDGEVIGMVASRDDTHHIYGDCIPGNLAAELNGGQKHIDSDQAATLIEEAPAAQLNHTVIEYSPSTCRHTRIFPSQCLWARQLQLMIPFFQNQRPAGDQEERINTRELQRCLIRNKYQFHEIMRACL